MVKIETENGVFEAETIKAAEKLAKAAAKKAEKERIEKSRLQQVAHVKAEAQAYRIMAAKMRPEGRMPRGWVFHSHVAAPYEPVQLTGEYWDKRIVVETESGKGTANFYGRDVLEGWVENGSGYCIAVVIRYDGMPSAVLAVGTHEGELAMAEVYGITASEFNQSKKN